MDFAAFNPDMVKLIISQGVFAILFVWLLLDTRKEAKNREEKAMDREEKLMDHLERTTDAIEKLSDRVDTIAEIATKK